MQPETRYAKSGDVNIAYQVVGEGPIDLVWVPGFVSHLEVGWEEPSYRRFFERLASFSRVIIFDKRGTGLSDRVSVREIPTLEERMDDIRAVMDRVGSKRAAVFGISEGASLAALFAATYPERTSALIVNGSFVGFPGVKRSEEQLQQLLDGVEQNWGQGTDLALFASDRAGDVRFRQWWARFQRMAASPGAAVAILRMNFEIDIKHVLPTIRVPTLVLHQSGDRAVPQDADRYMSQNITSARYVEVPGAHHWPWMGDSDVLLDEVQEFLTGVRPAPEPDRVLATALFTDVEGSTALTQRLGDAKARELLRQHERIVREALKSHGGAEVKTMGDGFMASFSSATKALECAIAVQRAFAEHNESAEEPIKVRAGLNAGEPIAEDDPDGRSDLFGTAVNEAARITAAAKGGEILVANVVRELAKGKDFLFADRGEANLKGFDEPVRLYEVRWREETT
jgi:class 3 adenylate cyclase